MTQQIINCFEVNRKMFTKLGNMSIKSSYRVPKEDFEHQERCIWKMWELVLSGTGMGQINLNRTYFPQIYFEVNVCIALKT